MPSPTNKYPTPMEWTGCIARWQWVLRTAIPLFSPHRAARRLALVAVLLLSGSVASSHAQDKPVIAPGTNEANIKILRGSDIVQPPSIWYQEGDEAPDSIGVLRVPCCPGDPDVITYRDQHMRFPVHLQIATFIRDGHIAELPISEEVLSGRKKGRIYLRPPAEDYYDIAEPAGVAPLRQVPGEETVIDVQEWYQAALRRPSSSPEKTANGGRTDDRFHTIRELRGRLRSTAPNGESISFLIIATRASRPTPTITIAPLPQERIVIPEPSPITIAFRTESIQRPNLDWTLSTALLAGPHRADLPRPGRDPYVANRIKGDVTSTLRWHASATESYAFTVFGSSQPTFSDVGDHHDVPYGFAIAARFGGERALELRAEAQHEDDPFQRQGFQLGDQRLRLLMGIDGQTSGRHWRLSIGPTYYRDLPSSWEQERLDVRELGYTVEGLFDRHLHIMGPFGSTFSASGLVSQSWGYVDDAGNRNVTLEGRMAFKPNVRFGSAQFALGPAVHLGFIDNEYAAIEGFSELNAQFGVEMTTRIRY